MPCLGARCLFVVTVFVLIAVRSTLAETWTGAVDNNWATQGNWDTNTVPGSGNAATFNSAGNGNTNISLGNSARPINTIAFDTDQAAAYNLGVLDSGDQFDFDSNGAISVSSTVANLQTINAAIVTAGDLTISVSNSSVPASNLGLKLAGGMTLNGNLTLLDAGAITVDRPITGPGLVSSILTTGALNLNAQSTYSGGTFFNMTTGQPAVRLGVDTVGPPGAVVSGPLGTGTITTQSPLPAVFQPVGGDRTLANDWIFVNAIFVGSTVSAPVVDPTPRNLTLSGNITLGSTGRVMTNNLPAGVALRLGSEGGSATISLGNRLSIQTQAQSGADGGVTIINNPIVDSGGTGAITVQNNAIVVMNNTNTYTGTTLLNGIAALPAPRLMVHGAITGGGAVTVNNNNTGTGSVLGGTGSVAPSQVNVKSGGTLSPGLRTLTIAEDDSLANIGSFRTGNLTMRGGSVFYYQFNSSGTPAADLLNADGTLSLQCTTTTCATPPAGPDVTGATLTVKDLAAMSTALSIGTKLTLVSYSGAWDLTTFDGLANGASLTIGANTFTIKYDDIAAGLNGGLYNNFVTLTAAPGGLPGDYNDDGFVDAADYVVWRKNPEGHGGDPAGYEMWRANFGAGGLGASSGGALGTRQVPEPGSASLVVFAVCSALVRVKRNFRGRSYEGRCFLRHVEGIPGGRFFALSIRRRRK
jgi:hypothetical protein